MAHFAEIKDGKVVRVIIVDNSVLIKDTLKAANPTFLSSLDIRNVSGKTIKVDTVDTEWEDPSKGISLCQESFGKDTTWVQASYAGNIRKKYPGIGDLYDDRNDAFISPQPFPSWSLDKNFDWQAPVPIPDDGKEYEWNEEEQKWTPKSAYDEIASK